MKKKIAILGSTGSIGGSLLKIVSKNKNNFEIILLTANKNYRKLLTQTKYFKVKNVIITNEESFVKFNKLNKNKNIKSFNSFKYLDKIFTKKIDYVMSSIIGLDGLDPTVQIIKYTKIIAIANKEAIICGWNLIKKKINRHNTNFIPVDSEHFSIWYGLKNQSISNIEKIYLTASGGPLLKIPNYKFNSLKINEILKHPNWKMGKKISVDSSTMMNKVFEIIEARNIFNIGLEKLSILIHPKSYLHAILFFKNGMINIIAHETTMEIPILNSIDLNNNLMIRSKKLNLEKLNQLKLEKVNKKKFPLVKILNIIPNKISLFETILVSANDELVRLYLNKKIKYLDINRILMKILNLNEFKKFKNIKANKVTDILDLDKYVRLKINSKGV
tara:strand:+ start:598 stop:1761 length:1164 start_codon:yes stop_codon:yes gene_type:complete